MDIALEKIEERSLISDPAKTAKELLVGNLSITLIKEDISYPAVNETSHSLAPSPCQVGRQDAGE